MESGMQEQFGNPRCAADGYNSAAKSGTIEGGRYETLLVRKLGRVIVP